MNKYMGFYELKEVRLPTVPWQIFTPDAVLDAGMLWTVRVAVENSADLNLPRAVGVTADEAVCTGRELLNRYNGKGIVVYYPYFIAQKSGVLEINGSMTVIEAVDRDLWNLVTHGRKNVTAMIPVGTTGMSEAQYHGDCNFLSREEYEELLGYAAILRGRFRGRMSEGGSVLAEWSYAYRTDTAHEPIGERYLVFYELRAL